MNLVHKYIPGGISPTRLNCITRHLPYLSFREIPVCFIATSAKATGLSERVDDNRR